MLPVPLTTRALLSVLLYAAWDAVTGAVRHLLAPSKLQRPPTRWE